MKKHFVLLSAVLVVFFSCSREVVMEEIQQDQTLTFTASWAESDGTKTIVQSNGTSVWWDAAEEINVFRGDQSGKFTSTNSQPQAVVEFQGSLPAGGSSANYWAVYPYNAANTCDGESVTITIPSSQTAVEGSFDNKMFPSVATSSDFKLAFFNVCGGILFSVAHEGISSVTFKSNISSQPLVGKVKVGFGSDGKPVIKSILDSSSEVTVNAPEGGFIPGKYYFATLLPRTLNKGLTMTFKTIDNQEATLSLDRSLSIVRSRFGKLDEKDKDLTFKAVSNTVIVGYAVYWEDTMPDPTLMTHINYAFAHIKNDFETLDIKTASRLSQIVALKKKNPALKVLLSVGGWEAGNFSEMAADETHRKNFCKNCLSAVQKYGLDGIDIDWEYPTSSAAGISSSPNDTKNFTLLMRDLRETLGENRLLTMASASNAKYVNFKQATQYMDFVNVMTYDMGNPPKHNAALYRSSMASESCEESVAKHFEAGVPYEKIVLGIPFYGHGDGKAFASYIDYRDLVINTSTYTVQWDDVAKVPYVTNSSGKMVFTYDDAKSVGLKADYILEKNLRGAMYWNIEADNASWVLSKAIASRLLPSE